MRAREFVTETVHPDVVSKQYFNDPTPNVKMGDFEFNARTFTGGLADSNARGLQIRAYDPKQPKGQNLIGSADFVVKSNKKGNRWLESDDTEVNDEYRGQGVAAMMYAFAKSLGNDIKDSPYKSKAGGDMWHKWGKDARHLVGEQSIAEYKKSREDFEGMTIEMVKNGHVLVINALDDWGDNVLGHVAFNIGDDNDLDPQELEVDERYQGQGIARAMYDYAKSKGYTIHRSYDQTPAGAGFWDKHRGEDVRVWEEEQLDELSFLGSQCTKDCSGHRAGYDWSKRKGLRQANSWSPSFNKGAGLAVAGK